MKRIGFNVSVTGNLTLKDCEDIINLHNLSEVSNKSDQKYYSKKVLSILTNIKNPNGLHLRLYLRKAIAAAGFSDPGKKTDNPLEIISSIIYQLSSRLNQTPKSIKEGVTKDDVKGLTDQLAQDRASHYINLIQVNHNPVEFHKKLFKEIQKTINKTIEFSKDYIQEYVKTSDIAKGFVSTGGACTLKPKGFKIG